MKNPSEGGGEGKVSPVIELVPNTSTNECADINQNENSSLPPTIDITIPSPTDSVLPASSSVSLDEKIYT